MRRELLVEFKDGPLAREKRWIGWPSSGTYKVLLAGYQTLRYHAEAFDPSASDFQTYTGVYRIRQTGHAEAVGEFAGIDHTCPKPTVNVKGPNGVTQTLRKGDNYVVSATAEVSVT